MRFLVASLTSLTVAVHNRVSLIARFNLWRCVEKSKDTILAGINLSHPFFRFSASLPKQLHLSPCVPTF